LGQELTQLSQEFATLQRKLEDKCEEVNSILIEKILLDERIKKLEILKQESELESNWNIKKLEDKIDMLQNQQGQLKIKIAQLSCEHDEVEELLNTKISCLEKIPSSLVSRVDGSGRKRSSLDSLVEGHSKRKLKQEVTDSLTWIMEVLNVSQQNLVSAIKELNQHNSITQSTQSTISVEDVIHLKDSILLADWCYQKLRNLDANLPTLHKVRNARQAMNKAIEQDLGIEFKDSCIKANPEKVLQLICKKHPGVLEIKLTFDHHINEGRDEVLVAFIPVIPKGQHSPYYVYPLAQ